jgi:hypothetical protein
MSSVDTAMIELLAVWKAEDATSDPEKLRQADEEIAEFQASNERELRGGWRSISLSVILSDAPMLADNNYAGANVAVLLAKFTDSRL